MLNGYSYVEVPNLSGQRFPSADTYLAQRTLALPDGNTEETFHTLIVASVARTLATYTATNDILISVQVAHTESPNVIRVRWDHETRWTNVTSAIVNTLGSNEGLSLPLVRDLLSLTTDQHPCVAFCNLNAEHSKQATQHPIQFFYDTKEQSLCLLGSETFLHPTVSEQILAQVCHLINHIHRQPQFLVSTNPIMPPELTSAVERVPPASISSVYSHTALLPFVTDYVRWRAKTMPHDTAVSWYEDLSFDVPSLNRETISYSLLNKKANQVGRWLIRQGLKEEGRVAICLDRNLHFHACIIGIMRAGGCYVPIDPELPMERKTYIVKDSGAEFLLTARHVAPPPLHGVATHYVEENQTQNDISLESGLDLSQMKENDLAYMLYTSGTTGNPKGCLLTHLGLSQAILALSHTASQAGLKTMREGRYLAVASIAFDVHLAETFVPFALGMPLISAKRSQLFENLPAYVNALKVTHLGIVPSLIEATLNAANDANGSDVTLRYIASGGEKMSDSILDKWADHPKVRLANFYGPSEVTIGCCARVMTSKTLRSNIGRPLANVSAYVVDSDMAILLRGGVGELVVEGPLVGRGYHGRPDLTAKAFLEWPRSDCWAYRTGDLVRMMPDSSIEIIGRIDTQIKLRGVRIESEGISAIVRKASFKGLTLDAVTILARHPQIGADQLVSFFCSDSTVPIAFRKSRKPYVVRALEGLVRTIKTICDAELPSYMRPSHLIPLSWLPLSGNGKIDGKFLTGIFCAIPIQTLSELSSVGHSRGAAQCTEEETAVFDIIRRHSSMPFDEPFPQLNIFECGMDSMATIRFTAELRATFNRAISASDVMKAQTLSAITKQLRSTSALEPINGQQLTRSFSSASLTEIAALYGDRVELLLPALPLQEGVLSRSAAFDHLYVQHVILSCKPNASLSQLREAWQHLTDVHPVLRTVFYFGKEVVQVVFKPTNPAVEWSQRQTEADNAADFAQQFLSTDAKSITRDINRDISSLSPYRLSVYISPAGTFFVLSIHHALYDGISLPRLLVELEESYSIKPTQLPGRTTDILKHIDDISLRDAEAFWHNELSGVVWPQFTLVNDQSTPPRQLAVPFKDPLSSFTKLASSQGVTLQALLTASFGYVVASRLYHKRDIVFGVLRSGRLLPVTDIEDAQLPLVSLVPSRVNFEEDGVLSKVQNSISNIIAYEHISLSKVQSWLREGTPLFEILFSCSVATIHNSKLWDLVESEPPQPDYPLAVEVVQRPHDDTLLIQAAWTDPALDSILPQVLTYFESLVVNLAQDTKALISQLRDDPSLFQPARRPASQTNIKTDDRPSALMTPLQASLQNIVADFFQAEKHMLSPSLSLFSIGLDSIKSVGLSRVLQSKGYVINAIEILRNASLESIASWIEKVPEDLAMERSLPGYKDLIRELELEIHPVDLKWSVADAVMVYPTSALQTGMLSQTIASEGKLYNHTFSLKLGPNVDHAHLRASWLKVCEGLDILRTAFNFLSDSGRWVQVVHSLPMLSWSETEHQTVDNYPSLLREFFHEKTLCTTDQFNSPPIRFHLFKFADSNSRLCIVIHHALYDGISIHQLINAAEKIYRGDGHQFGSQFHELLSHILWQEQEATSFWVDRLKPCRPSPLKILHPHTPSVVVIAEKLVKVDLEKLKFILAKGVTAQCIGQAALARALSQQTGSTDVLFGHTVSGRNMPGSEDVIGPVLNTIPFYVRLASEMTNMDLVTQIHTLNTDSLEWQHASLRALQRALGPGVAWDTLFLFQPFDDSDVSKVWSFDKIELANETNVQYPLNIELSQNKEGFVLRSAARSEVFSKTDLHDFLSTTSNFLADIINHPNAIIHHHSLFGSSSRHIASDKVVDATRSNVAETSIPNEWKDMLISVTRTSSEMIKPEAPLSALGIDSITAIQLVAKFKVLGLRISAMDVLASLSISDMLSKLSPISGTVATRRGEDEGSISQDEYNTIIQDFGCTATSIESILPSTSGLSWLVGAWQRSEGTRFQHVFAYRVSNETDLVKLESAWSSLVARHAILRSTVRCQPTNPHELSIVVFKKEHMPNSWTEELADDPTFFASLLQRMQTLVCTPPSLDTPPTRAILRRSMSQTYLLLRLHHFQYDAWSLQLLLLDFSCLCKGVPSTVSGDLAGYISATVPAADVKEEQKAYWEKSLSSGFRPSYFPRLRSNRTYPPDRLILTNFSCITNASLCEERARSLGLSMQAIFLASWARVQAEYCRSAASTFGLWVSGRTGSFDEVASLAVPCMNVLPLRVAQVQESDILSLAKTTQSDLRLRTAYVEQSNQVDIARWVGCEHTPLVNVFVNIVKTGAEVEDDILIFEPVEVPYVVPDKVEVVDRQISRRIAMTTMIQDDLFIDIATLEKTDTILMSLDAAAFMMDEVQADIIISKWAFEVQHALGIV